MRLLLFLCLAAGLAAHAEDHAQPAPDPSATAGEPAGMSGMTKDEEPAADDEALTIPHLRMASGTAWQPDTSPMRAVHLMAGGWMFMLHGTGSLGWDWENGPRGGRTAMSTNWVMAMAQHELLGGELMLRTMLSLEAATVPPEGYPELLQSGETYNGVQLHDRQHPHDLFMEVAADYRRPLNHWLGFELYGGPSGEPALGPVAFMHRASAVDDPIPPIGHHWQDSTHVTFGVATAGLYTQDIKLEASWFNGREPDQDRWNFDLRPFDSYSVRLSAVPEEHIAVQVSYGYLKSPEPPTSPDEVQGESRITASITYSGSGVDTSLIWGRNLELSPLDSFLLESHFDLGGGNAPFFRLERVDKTAADLLVASAPPAEAFTVYDAVLGFAHHFASMGPIQPALAVRGSLAFVPSELSSLYGGRVQPGAYAYLLLQAAPMR